MLMVVIPDIYILYTCVFCISKFTTYYSYSEKIIKHIGKRQGAHIKLKLMGINTR